MIIPCRYFEYIPHSTQFCILHSAFCIPLDTAARLAPVQRLDGRALKITALVCMFIDHFTKVILMYTLGMFLRNPMLEAGTLSPEADFALYNFHSIVLCGIGAVAFPLYCFLLVEGFQHTSSRKRYFGSLAFFALISEIPFDMTFFGPFAEMEGTVPFYWWQQNVFFTFLQGFIAMAALEKLRGWEKKVPSILLQILTVGALILLADQVVHADYEAYGVLLIVLFYLFRGSRTAQVLAVLIGRLLVFPYQGHLPSFFIALALILLYNGQRGNQKHKYFFYWFYPAHISLLYVVSKLLEGILRH